MDLVKYPLKYMSSAGKEINVLTKLTHSCRINDENVISFEIPNGDYMAEYIEDTLSIDSAFYMYLPQYAISGDGWQQYKLYRRKRTEGIKNITLFDCTHVSYELNNYTAATYSKTFPAGTTRSTIIADIISSTGAGAKFTYDAASGSGGGSSSYSTVFNYTSTVTARRLLYDFIKFISGTKPDTSGAYLLFDNYVFTLKLYSGGAMNESPDDFYTGINLNQLEDLAIVESGSLNRYYSADVMVNNDGITPGELLRVYKSATVYYSFPVASVFWDYLNPDNHRIEFVSSTKRLSDVDTTIKRGTAGPGFITYT
jgi:hypothetical protein